MRQPGGKEDIVSKDGAWVVCHAWNAMGTVAAIGLTDSRVLCQHTQSKAGRT